MHDEAMNQEAASDMDATLQRIREKLAARPPDGQFGEYRDKVAFSILEQVVPLTRASTPEVLDNIMETTPLGTPSASQQVVTHVHNPSSLFNRALLACLDEPQAPESVQVFSQFAGYAHELPGDIVWRPPEEQRIWSQRVRLVGQAALLVGQREYFEQRAFGEPTTTVEMQTLVDALMHHIGQVGESIQVLQGADFLAVMQLLDVQSAMEDAMMMSSRVVLSKIKTIPRRRNIPEQLYDFMEEARTDAGTTWQWEVFHTKIESALVHAWERAQAGWTWRDVNQVLGTFPTLESQGMRLRVVDALEDASEAELAGVLTGQELAAEGLAALIHLDIYKNLGPIPMAREIILDKNEVSLDVTFADVTLPRDMAPVASVALLGSIAESMPADDFIEILTRMQEVICSKPSAVATTINEWLLTLALLRKNPNEQVRQQTDAFIAREGFPHVAFQQIITGQKPGHVYLVAGNKIRVDTKLANGRILASSSFVAPEEPQPPAGRAATGSSGITSHTSPEKGAVAVPGVQRSKRRERKDTRKQLQRVPEVGAAQEQERPQPIIVLPRGMSLESLGEQISPGDLAIVAKAIADNQEHGQHPLISLRSRTPEGALLCKMRVNGKDSGIRVIFAHVGNNQFEIRTIQYRGAVYKDTLFD